MIYHSRHTTRLPRLDYSLPNTFFVTLCAYQHGCYFSKYLQLEKIVNQQLSLVSNYFPNVSIIKQVVMPNHLHLIIKINYHVPQVTLGKIIGVFKGRVVNVWLKHINDTQLNERACIWQRNYYEHRIRNPQELKQYSRYIDLNPLLWNKDPYHPYHVKKCRGFARRNPL